MEGYGCGRMLRAPGLLADRQGAFIEELGLDVTAQKRQLAQFLGRFGDIRATFSHFFVLVGVYVFLMIFGNLRGTPRVAEYLGFGVPKRRLKEDQETPRPD